MMQWYMVMLKACRYQSTHPVSNLLHPTQSPKSFPPQLKVRSKRPSKRGFLDYQQLQPQDLQMPMPQVCRVVHCAEVVQVFQEPRPASWAVQHHSPEFRRPHCFQQ